MKKPSIPDVPHGTSPRGAFDTALKETLESITGRRGGVITPLADTATTADIITKINDIIAKVQG